MDESNKGWHPGRAARLLAAAVVWVVLIAGAAWAFGALWFDFPHPWLRKIVAIAFVAALGAVTFFVRPRWRAKIAIALAITVVMMGWLSLQPRQFRDWKPEVARTARAQIEGDIVTFHNVRNFDYRSETDFTPLYETRRLDLRNLRGVDIFITYWGSPYMAHPILSFDFGPDGRICFSIETRPEKGESYSALGGLYRQFELIYVVADERDVIRVRSNYRQGEEVYLYRLKAKAALPAFMEYVNMVNELNQTPRWYNAITNNCTSAIRNQRTASERAPWDWRMLVNGFGDELLYQRGAIDNTLPFAALKRLSHVNERARAANDAPDFSEKIRAGLPGMDR
ncbi:MAG: DUF4105 domain-containing protein [Akkermansiaceae bacterium]|nr:DUF4105 domain-containing protein [Akkermansiaceae bacterium]